MNNKKVLFIETITIFLSMFLFHNIYNWFPNFLTASFFLVNESLFEHLKLMFTTQIIISLIIYLILKLKKIKFSNYLLGLLISTIVTISLFFLIYFEASLFFLLSHHVPVSGRYIGLIYASCISS